MGWVYLSVAIFLNSLGNILIKENAKKNHVGFDEFFNFLFLCAVVFFGLNLIAYSKAQATLPLSVAYTVLIGGSFAIILIYDHLFFNEVFSLLNCLGMLCVIIGIILLVR